MVRPITSVTTTAGYWISAKMWGQCLGGVIVRHPAVSTCSTYSGGVFYEFDRRGWYLKLRKLNNEG
jgi:hypothetical protein